MLRSMPPGALQSDCQLPQQLQHYACASACSFQPGSPAAEQQCTQSSATASSHSCTAAWRLCLPRNAAKHPPHLGHSPSSTSSCPNSWIWQRKHVTESAKSESASFESHSASCACTSREPCAAKLCLWHPDEGAGSREVVRRCASLSLLCDR